MGTQATMMRLWTLAATISFTLAGGTALAAGNAVGGYVVTERMLKMFVSAGRKQGVKK